MLYIPIVVMMVFSFNDQRYNYYWNGFTTQWYASFSTTPRSSEPLVLPYHRRAGHGHLGGHRYARALGLKKYEFHGKKLVNNMLYVPIIVPEIVLAVALLIIFMNLGLSLGMGSILIGHCTFCIPYAVVTIKGRISGDGDTLEEASMDLGANRIQTFFRVTLPSIMPGVKPVCASNCLGMIESNAAATHDPASPSPGKTAPDTFRAPGELHRDRIVVADFVVENRFSPCGNLYYNSCTGRSRC